MTQQRLPPAVAFPTAEEIHIGGIAVAFHDAYERLAPEFGWDTQEASRVEWMDLPENQKRLMEAVVGQLIKDGTIK